MQPYLEKICAQVDGYVGGLPVPYRTTEEHPTFFNLPDGGCSCHLPTETTFPTALERYPTIGMNWLNGQKKQKNRGQLHRIMLRCFPGYVGRLLKQQEWKPQFTILA
nr:hypothetical protein [Sinobaca sp. H24]